MIVRSALAWVVASSALISSVNAFDGPQVSCAISVDKSSVLVTASNADGKSYQCTIWCKTKTVGTRAFTPLTCNVRITPTMSAKVVCDLTAPSSGDFTAIVSQKSTCVPR